MVNVTHFDYVVCYAIMCNSSCTDKVVVIVEEPGAIYWKSLTGCLMGIVWKGFQKSELFKVWKWWTRHTNQTSRHWFVL